MPSAPKLTGAQALFKSLELDLEVAQGLGQFGGWFLRDYLFEGLDLSTIETELAPPPVLRTATEERFTRRWCQGGEGYDLDRGVDRDLKIVQKRHAE